jgi:hypothetical protein
MDANELDALIAANIGDLEAVIRRVSEKIDPRVNSEAWQSLKKALSHSDFHFDDGDDPDDAWFAPRSWLNEEGDSDPWFELNARDGSGLDTWLACYVAPGTEREAIGIQWHYNNLYARDYSAILESHLDELRLIEQAGFHRDGKSIYLPISFSVAEFEEGFRQGDLTEALAPVAVAAVALEQALPSFQRLRDAMIAKAKG